MLSNMVELKPSIPSWNLKLHSFGKLERPFFKLTHIAAGDELNMNRCSTTCCIDQASVARYTIILYLDDN